MPVYFSHMHAWVYFHDATTINYVQSVINHQVTRKTTQEIDHYNSLLDNAQSKYKQYHSLSKDLQLTDYVLSGTIQFSLIGPNLNKAWSLFRPTANTIIVEYHNYPTWSSTTKTDILIKRAGASQTCKPTHITAYVSRAWGQYRFSLGHNRRNHSTAAHPLTKRKLTESKKKLTRW